MHGHGAHNAQMHRCQRQGGALHAGWGWGGHVAHPAWLCPAVARTCCTTSNPDLRCGVFVLRCAWSALHTVCLCRPAPPRAWLASGASCLSRGTPLGPAPASGHASGRLAALRARSRRPGRGDDALPAARGRRSRCRAARHGVRAHGGRDDSAAAAGAASARGGRAAGAGGLCRRCLRPPPLPPCCPTLPCAQASGVMTHEGLALLLLPPTNEST